MEKYSVVWLPLSPRVRFVADLGAVDTVHLPIFLFGSDLSVFRASGGVNVQPLTLLLGILFGGFDAPPGVEADRSVRLYPRALDLLARELRMNDVEDLILTAGAFMREEFGSAESVRVLGNGLRLLPHSSTIRSDRIVDLWTGGEQRNESEYLPILRDIVSLLQGIDWSALAPEPRHALSRIAAIAFSEVEPAAWSQYSRDNLSSEDLNWDEAFRRKFAAYVAARRFSWKLLST